MWIFLHFSSDFEEYEQDKDAEYDPSFSSGPENKLSAAENQILDDSPLDFLNETENLDSQEDFVCLQLILKWKSSYHV